MSADRYEPVNAAWAAIDKPAITREEAARAVTLLYRKFGRKADGGPRMLTDMKFNGAVRRCWISTKPTTGIDKGWARLVHDVSHRVFYRRFPAQLAHAPAHARLEREITEYVLASGWLTGTLKPKVKAKPTGEAARALKLARIDGALVRWDAKLRRASNAMKKLTRQRKRLLRVAK